MLFPCHKLHRSELSKSLLLHRNVAFWLSQNPIFSHRKYGAIPYGVNMFNAAALLEEMAALEARDEAWRAAMGHPTRSELAAQAEAEARAREAEALRTGGAGGSGGGAGGNDAGATRLMHELLHEGLALEATHESLAHGFLRKSGHGGGTALAVPDRNGSVFLSFLNKGNHHSRLHLPEGLPKPLKDFYQALAKVTLSHRH